MLGGTIASATGGDFERKATAYAAGVVAAFQASKGKGKGKGGVSTTKEIGLISSDRSKNIRAYVSDIETITNRKIPAKQKAMLKDDLRNNKYSRLSQEQTELNRKDFNKKVPELRREWEKETGQIWPKDDKGNNYKE